MSRAHIPEPELASLSLNGPPAGAAMPAPGAAGPAIHMQSAPVGGYTADSLETTPSDLEGVDLRNSAENKQQAYIQCEWRGTAEEFANASSINQRTCAIGTFPGAWSAVDADDKPVDLSRAVILGVTARSMHNSFPMPVAIKFAGSAKPLNQLSTRLGKVAAVMAHKESSRGTHELYVPSDAVSTRHFRCETLPLLPRGPLPLTPFPIFKENTPITQRSRSARTSSGSRASATCRRPAPSCRSWLPTRTFCVSI